ncbi:SIR2 family protein [Paenibacillus woosongensis]|uniref:SIR2 family protein n=1 Tax=Paenibacillus woosongensis TaxID=307580 RepID=A0A7X2Z3J9_9BACL|nr:SIR2 family protein [Paenibacillus woosongensis]MUG46967.1 SIR2 family protein [Paenibacillus woosongensis]WHX49387.1 SIR2 family protein [Paenibacillus woosongensis]
MSVHLEDLCKDYSDNKIVPFIGAGLSIPFNVPDWSNLIRSIADKYAVDDLDFVKLAVEKDLQRYDYWQAIDTLKNYTTVQEEDIQEHIANTINTRIEMIENELLHNYFDLQKMDFNLYLTTNYENILQEYLKCKLNPILLKDIQFNIQNLFDERRVLQLHGTTSNYGTIVISRDSYRTLYNDKKYESLLQLITGSKKLLFMGFSFDDQFIRTLIREHRQFFMSKHYIILADPTQEKIKELREEYGLLTIPYKTSESTHAIEIRKILEQLNRHKQTNLNNPQSQENQTLGNSIVVGAGIDDFNKNMANNLFYKKLEIENIDQSLIELSSAFYVASEEYIRELKKAGIPLNIIDAMLGKVFIKYKERYVDTYKKHGNSEEFLTIVHSSLENLDYGRIKQLLNNNLADEDETRGLIHILADDEKMKVWWGENRC